ncbi:MAG: hypothetical protein ACSLFQ_05195 [Thermoanaerobaculia bacterium]
MRLLVPLAICLAAVVALSLGVRNENFVDAALPLCAAAVATVAWLEGRRFGDAKLAFAIPLLAVWRIGVVDENLRLFLYGITLAGALAIFIARATAGGGKLRTGEALVLVAACLAATRLVPWSAELAPAQAIVIIGTMVLAASLAGRDGVGAGTILVCLAAGLVTPLAPLKATLFPLLLASVLAVLRGPSPFSVAALVASAALAGRWAWPMAALTLASGLLSEMLEPVLDRRRAQAQNAVAAAPLAALPAASGALSAFLWSPESALRVFRLARPARITAVALVAAALVLRPALGTLYMIAALAIFLTDEFLTVGADRGDEPARSGIPIVAAVFTVAMLSLAGFSGAVVSRFPLPLPLAELAAVAVVALAATVAGRFPAIGSAMSAVALVVVVAIAGAPATVEPIEARAVLAAGETWELELPPGSGVRVELSGGNLTGLEPGTPVGTLEAIDRAGRAVRREVEIGDLADWGMGRPGHYFASRNEWPRSTQAVVAEYGHQAFLEGSGTVAIGIPDMVRLRITASPTLPERGRLNLESVKGVRR